MKKTYKIFLLLILILLSCRDNSNLNNNNAKNIIFVSITPQAYLVERIAGKDFEVVVLIPPEKNPHIYEPTPKQLIELGNASIFFTIGVPFEEAFVKKIKNNNKLKIVNLLKGIETIETHGGCENCKEEHDPHVWLGIKEIKILSKNIKNALVELDNKNKDKFEENFELLIKDIEKVDIKLSKSLKPYRGRKFFVFHPAFSYFASTYGLIQESIEVEGKSPSPKQIEKIIFAAKKDNVKIIFLQPQFEDKAAKVIAKSIDGVVAKIDPLAKDILKNLETIAKEIEKALNNKE